MPAKQRLKIIGARTTISRRRRVAPRPFAHRPTHWKIEARAKRPLADEYDAAQERGEIATRQNNPGSARHVPNKNMPATTAERRPIPQGHLRSPANSRRRKARSGRHLTERPRIAPGLRSADRANSKMPHPLEFRRGVILPLPHEALLMRLEVGDAMPDLLALRSCAIHRWRAVRFHDGTRHHRFDANALCERHRLFDQRVEIYFPIEHGLPFN